MAGTGGVDGSAFWNRVTAYNREHPIADEAATRVTFYFGQSVTPPADAEQAAAIVRNDSIGNEGEHK
jgi:hypothetical protein